MFRETHLVQVRRKELAGPNGVWGTRRPEVSRLYVLAGAGLEAPGTSVFPAERVAAVAADVLSDHVLELVSSGALTSDFETGAGSYILIGRHPGVTDDEGLTAQRCLARAMPELRWPAEQIVFSRTLYVFAEALAQDELERFGALLGNPVVDAISVGAGLPHEVVAPTVMLTAPARSRTVPLPEAEADLVALSRGRGWGLSGEEMRAIADYFAREGREPTECELEVFAQTWSEHCKHKEFNARIDMTFDGARYEVDSLFKSFIRGSTEAVRAKYATMGEDWMLTVFNDNAGVVSIDEADLFVLKVETHNSPSALDPEGGAMTGVLGTNRDAFGTGKGGARLLFNTNVLCFGPRDYAEPLLPGQMHPARIMDGVVSGIEHAGNKCGVPTVGGAIVFDARYAGKPLVYCGTGAVMPARYPNGPSWEKDLKPGYRIVVVGGRVGQDGIHGATFSSAELTSGVSRSVVQIGSPITQKLVADFMEEACAQGLVAASTDNGAGGLSSSIGELGGLAGGAEVALDDVPLKYQGLEPWEIFLSESQERMTLAVRPSALHALLELAERLGVEATDIGAFTGTGRLVVTYGETRVADLDLAFLHDGVPRKHLIARWQTPEVRASSTVHTPLTAEAACDGVLRLLRSANISSRERVIRRFDHEVKGKSVLKSLMGASGKAPQDAAVMRVSYRNPKVGVAIASGLCPKFVDLDPYHMAYGAFDEALRSLVSVGVRLPAPGEAPSFSACDNFCVPDSVFHPEHNPDGAAKLGQLVRMCEALDHAVRFFDVPMTSGKDSMKNDFRAGGKKISVPPTVLFTMVARVPDVARVLSADFKASGDLLYVLGDTHEELGASEWLRLHDDVGGAAPAVRPARARDVYLRHNAAHAAELLESSHDVSDGGLLVCIAEALFGRALGPRPLGARVDLTPLLQPRGARVSGHAVAFGESHSRLVVTVRRERRSAFEAIVGDAATYLGEVTDDGLMRVTLEGSQAQVSARELLSAYEEGGV
jgi:phosphoribosylformylglycinamidine synthase